MSRIDWYSVNIRVWHLVTNVVQGMEVYMSIALVQA
jgi:hypothetical protein